MIKFWVTASPRRRRHFTLSDTQPHADVKTRRLSISEGDLIEYLQAKAVVEKWQDRFGHLHRYGWY